MLFLSFALKMSMSVMSQPAIIVTHRQNVETLKAALDVPAALGLLEMVSAATVSVSKDNNCMSEFR